MVVKYADNILKNFANALSVILTVIGAAPLFGQYPSPWFIVGAAAVTLSVYMYSQSSLAVRRRRPSLSLHCFGRGTSLFWARSGCAVGRPTPGSLMGSAYPASATVVLLSAWRFVVHHMSRVWASKPQASQDPSLARAPAGL